MSTMVTSMAPPVWVFGISSAMSSGKKSLGFVIGAGVLDMEVQMMIVKTIASKPAASRPMVLVEMPDGEDDDMYGL